MKKFRFRQFQVYNDSRAFLLTVKKISRDHFPADERFRLIHQIDRALSSVILNIAEGADRSTDKDFALFLNRSHTSLNEVVACMDIALDSKYINADIHGEILLTAEKLANQLTAFRMRLLTK
jgi:four helix bundle protein